MSVEFSRDIVPLFRDDDVESMRFAFSLDQYEDVALHAEAIYERLSAGDMPCDRPWPIAQVAIFRQWIDDGMHA